MIERGRQWGWAAGAVAVALLAVWLRASPALFIHGASGLIDWNYTQLLFRYDAGFIKRGLLGTLLGWLPGTLDYATASRVAYALLGVLAVAFLLPFVRVWRAAEGRAGALWLLLLAVTSPATLGHFARDVGRTDAVVLALAIALLLGLGRLGGARRGAAAALVLSVNGAAILIHEAAFFMVVPLTLAFWHYRDAARAALAWQGACLAALTALTYLVSTRGGFDAVPLAERFAELQSAYGAHVDKGSLSVLYHTGLAENVRHTLAEGFRPARLAHHAVLLAALLPFGYVAVRVLAAVRRDMSVRAWLLLAAAFSPLALYPLGHDHFRWWSLAITNALVAFALLCRAEGAVAERALACLEASRRWVWAALLLALVTGPLGVVTSVDVAAALPWLETLR
ncbi:hypothetical protein P1P91_05985 [Halomonas piscis]|uniref:Glycosyltransferase RgtA/B/C/D-like domain-containing protein n=1 Tax=Halomonas piscis TaxID=3031727 RepID=A0ABY9Z2V3_9GAMM|nr:hypothetical protein [Halomonas piscis]WNK21222.1 hypothetical protein P1P91_05985 [Halomonas piscis]